MYLCMGPVLMYSIENQWSEISQWKLCCLIVINVNSWIYFSAVKYQNAMSVWIIVKFNTISRGCVLQSHFQGTKLTSAFDMHQKTIQNSEEINAMEKCLTIPPKSRALNLFTLPMNWMFKLRFDESFFLYI